jgi:hypothetical protein
MTKHSVACSLWEHKRERVPGVEVLSHAVAMAMPAQVSSAQVSIHGSKSIDGLDQSWWTSLAVMARRVVPVCRSMLSEEVQCC